MLYKSLDCKADYDLDAARRSSDRPAERATKKNTYEYSVTDLFARDSDVSACNKRCQENTGDEKCMSVEESFCHVDHQRLEAGRQDGKVVRCSVRMGCKRKKEDTAPGGGEVTSQ